MADKHTLTVREHLEKLSAGDPRFDNVGFVLGVLVLHPDSTEFIASYPSGIRGEKTVDDVAFDSILVASLQNVVSVVESRDPRPWLARNLFRETFDAAAADDDDEVSPFEALLRAGRSGNDEPLN